MEGFTNNRCIDSIVLGFSFSPSLSAAPFLSPSLSLTVGDSTHIVNGSPQALIQGKLFTENKKGGDHWHPPVPTELQCILGPLARAYFSRRLKEK